MSQEPLSVIKGTLELLVLKALARKQEAHGFEVLDWIEATSGRALSIEEGALYPALHRMEKRGLLDSVWGVSGKGRRAKYYRLTEAGREALDAQEGSWERYVEAVARLGTQGSPSGEGA